MGTVSVGFDVGGYHMSHVDRRSRSSRRNSSTQILRLDLAVADVTIAAAMARDLGATPLLEEEEEEGLVVLRSPGGQAFCLVSWCGESRRPAVVAGPGGAISRLDQLSFDLAADVYDREARFWQELTGWEVRDGSRPEFRVVKPPATMPARILLQRLDEPRPASTHPDLSCSDREAVRAWHESLGAAVVARFPHWITMRDPVGGTYCLTARDPHTGGLAD
ncbi:MAG TPA: VOC family protein [Micromonosporaceae bacterium]|nr:VOC family protein [Micromonosporaceae bacterium]